MVRVNLKGGVWTNSEDEILKLGVMKYGKNNWSRVASLLNRKTPKQCKARWFEWLDPNIKKTEWTSEEDDQLLHCFKILPDQWRTIAPMFGRTATQCIERFEFLCDNAMKKDTTAISSTETRKLLVGEIDPTPEARAARPDAVDMDEDQKQMVQQARARLANTQGKKAKRKAREKHLEEARRLAQLQKYRELKAAGITVAVKEKNKTGIDYNKEIPFLHVPTVGSFSIDEERELSSKMQDNASFIGTDMTQQNKKSADAREQKEREKDMRKERFKKQIALPEMIKKLNDINDPIAIRQRPQFSLPSPQLDDQDIADLAKKHGNTTGGLEAALAAQKRDLTESHAQSVDSQEIMMAKLRNIMNARDAPAVLTGGEAPMKEIIPDDLATLQRQEKLAKLQKPTLEQQRRNIPRPDKSQVNRLRSLLASLPAAENEYGLVWPELPSETSFDAITLLQTSNTDQANVLNRLDTTEDAELIAERKERIEKARRNAEFNSLSSVMKRKLDRPSRVNIAMGQSVLKKSTDKDIAIDELLLKETVGLVRFDNAKFPVNNDPVNPKQLEMCMIDTYTEKELNSADTLITEELQSCLHSNEILQKEYQTLVQIKKYASTSPQLTTVLDELPLLQLQYDDTEDMNVDEDKTNDIDTMNDIDDDVESPRKKRKTTPSNFDIFEKYDQYFDQYALQTKFVPTKKEFANITTLDETDCMATLRQELEILYKHIQLLRTKNEKMESLTKKKSTGYILRMKTIQKDILKTYASFQDLLIKKKCFELMASAETDVIINKRQEELQSAIEQLKLAGQQSQKEIQKLHDTNDQYITLISRAQASGFFNS